MILKIRLLAIIYSSLLINTILLSNLIVVFRIHHLNQLKKYIVREANNNEENYINFLEEF
jgi:hypothetical protein